MYEEINQILRKKSKRWRHKFIVFLNTCKEKAGKEITDVARAAKKGFLVIMHVSIIVIAGKRERESGGKKSKFFVNSDKQRVMYHFNDWTSSLSFYEAL